jgi:hypothetical protein
MGDYGTKRLFGWDVPLGPGRLSLPDDKGRASKGLHLHWMGRFFHARYLNQRCTKINNFSNF